MKFTSTAILSLLPAYGLAVTLGYDNNYGVGSNHLSSVACSDGDNGLLSRGFTTFDSLPTFPRIASTSEVAGWNSAQCGSCWELTYTNSNGVASSIVVTAVDHASAGFYTSVDALNELTGGRAIEVGTVNVVATSVDRANCGL